MDELALIRDARRGDVDAFNTLVLNYQNVVYNLAYRIIGNPDSAADATQEAFISAYRALGGFRGGSFKSWLLRIVTNACYDELRRQKRRPASSLEELEGLDETADEPVLTEPLEGPEAHALRRELGALLEQAIASLPDDQRITLVLCDIQELSYEETAAAMNTNVGTVKSRLSRARAKLRDFLRARGELLPSAYRPEVDKSADLRS
jgi:RNA polymerase sigma-70 factor (ECF subfamily)